MYIGPGKTLNCINMSPIYFGLGHFQGVKNMSCKELIEQTIEFS